MKTRWQSYTAACVMLMFGSCSSGEKGNAKCVPGASVECACTQGGKGAQVCQPDGTFGPCQCEAEANSLNTQVPDVIAPEKRRSLEAHENAMKIYQGARQYYLDTPDSGKSEFPSPSVGPTPRLGTCCQQGGQCTPDPGQWTAHTWQALQFSMDDPHLYSYEYITNDPTSSFTVRAYGDLDCNGIYSTFELVGAVDANNPADGPPSRPKIRKVKEFE